MNKQVYKDIFLLLLAILFSTALMFAFIELPLLIDMILQERIGFPGFDQGVDEFNVYKADLYISSLHLRWIGYGSLALIICLIVIGFITKKSGWAWAGAIALFLPVFGQFALSMFFLAGLGILRVGWIPFLDISFNILELGDLIYIPYWILMWLFRLFGWYAHNFLAYLFMFSGALLFVWGVLVWLQTRFSNRGFATQLIYKYSRHPQYLGWIIWSYGFVLFSPGVNQMKKSWSVPSSLPWLLTTMVIIGICMLEEMRMKELQGEAYENYRKTTPFLIPMPRWLKWVIKAPQRLIIRKERPEKKREVAWVILLYTCIFMLLSLFWVDFKKDRTVPPETQADNLLQKVDTLIAEINNPHHRRELYKYFEELGYMGNVAVHPLINLLSDTDPVIRGFAAQTIGEFNDSAAIDPLISALSDSISRVRNNAVGSLGKTGSVKAVKPLLSLLEGNKETGSRNFVYHALGEIGSEEGWPVLITGLNDSIWYNRVAALNALYKIADQKSAEYVIRALEDRDHQIRRNAVFIILQDKSEIYRKPLEKVIDDEDFETRFYAREAIKQIENK